jgi:hypothetical protein
MTVPQVADGGEGLEVWRVAVNKPTSGRGQLTRGGPPACGLGGVLTTTHSP